jgi:hypothetical protein
MSAHAVLAPSAAERWLHCTPAPRLEAELPETTSEYAEEGTLAHKVCDLLARKKYTIMKLSTYNAALKKLRADPLWQDEMLTTATTYVEHLAENAMKFEHAPYLAFEVRVDISDYVPEAFGRCDCVMIGGDELIITDYKHGKGVPVSSQENPQMMLYALGALKLYRPIYGDMIRRVTAYIDQPRLDSYSGYTLTVDELLAWGESTVKPKAAAAFAGLGEYTPGEWCRFCRAKVKCRARADSQTALEDFKNCAYGSINPDDPQPLGRDQLLTDTEVGDLLKRGKTLIDWYNGLKEYALATCLDGGTIPGWKAVEGRSTRAWTDQDKALEAILNAGHPRELVYDTVPKTLAQLEKLIGPGSFGELVGSLVIKPPGKPALAPESDKRPPYSGAAADFGGVEDDAVPF